MMGQAVSFTEKPVRNSDYRPNEYGLANALARKVRREYPSKPVEGAAAEYGLTINEARSLVFATAGRRTVDKALKAGGWGLVLELAADVLGQPLENYIEEQAAKARHERIIWEARERDHQARLSVVSDLGLGDRRAL